MTLLFATSLALLCLATYFAALSLSLLAYSEVQISERLAAKGREASAGWLSSKLNECRLSVALLRTITRLGLFITILIEIVGLGEDATLTLSNLLVAGAITAALLWVFTSLVASALARYACTGIVTTAIWWMHIAVIACFPLTKSTMWIDEVVRRLSGAAPDDNPAEEAILHQIAETQRRGMLDEDAATMLENVVEFGTTDVGEVMTPRTDVNGIEYTDDFNAIRDAIAEFGHSRIPVYEDNLDNILGILYAKDLLPYLGREANGFKLKPILRAPTRVPETKSVRELLADFQTAEVHLAIVIDEYGGTAGLVTIEDVLEELVGEIHDEHDADEQDEPTLQTIDETRAEVDGRFHIDDLNEALSLDLPEDEEYDTVAGYVLDQLGRVPEVGEAFESEDARFTVLDASPTHIQRIGIELTPDTPDNGQARDAAK